MEKDFLTVKDAAQRLGLKPARVYVLVAEARVPCVRRGKRILIPRAAWTSWLAREAERALHTVAEG